MLKKFLNIKNIVFFLIGVIIGISFPNEYMLQIILIFIGAVFYAIFSIVEESFSSPNITNGDDKWFLMKILMKMQNIL